MSDDLERAISKAKDALDDFNAVGPPTSNADLVLRAIVPAALLSFLDMDEAGVERVAKALAWQCRGPRYPSETADTFWCDLVEDEHKEEWGVVARAVLSELRKMAGEKETENAN